MEIIKKPLFENDSYLFRFDSNEKFAPVLDRDYLSDKAEAFEDFDIHKKRLVNHFNRASFQSVDEEGDLRGTIYTHKAVSSQGYTKFRNLIKDIRINKSKGRKCYLSFADSISDFLNPGINTSCLAAIHFLDKKVNIVFRASCMASELHYDLILIKKFFIDAVYQIEMLNNEPILIEVYASTAQNIIDPKSYFLIP